MWGSGSLATPNPHPLPFVAWITFETAPAPIYPPWKGHCGCVLDSAFVLAPLCQCYAKDSQKQFQSMGTKLTFVHRFQFNK